MSVSRKMTDAQRLVEIVRRANASIACDVREAKRYSKQLREMRARMPAGYPRLADDEYRHCWDQKRAALRRARCAHWILNNRWERRHYRQEGAPMKETTTRIAEMGSISSNDKLVADGLKLGVAAAGDERRVFIAFVKEGVGNAGIYLASIKQAREIVAGLQNEIAKAEAGFCPNAGGGVQ